ncbi:MAG: signal peptidase I, partial [Planctomycetes bacterium]|nr:signal peptidase I [Planctomycetota bacterium]
MADQKGSFFQRKFKPAKRAAALPAFLMVFALVLLAGVAAAPLLAGTFPILATLFALAAIALFFKQIQATQAHLRGEAPDATPASPLEVRLGIALTLVLVFLIVLSREAPPLTLAAVAGLLVQWAMRSFVSIPPAPLEGGSGASYKPLRAVDSFAGLIVAVCAIVVAYGFGLRAFQIPTGSMEPTLFGKPVVGERAIINLADYALADPQRGDITVFRYPLGRGQDYVKRLIAQGGDTALIYQGDVYLQKEGDAYPKIWRKDARLRKTLWLPYSEFSGGQAQFAKGFGGLKGASKADAKGVTLTPDGEAAAIRFPKEGTIKDHDPSHEPDPSRAPLHNTEGVNDLRLVTTIELSASSSAEVHINSPQHKAVFRFPVGEKPSVSVTRGEQELAKGSIEIELSPEREYLIDIAVADGEVFLSVDGQGLSDALYFETEIEGLMRVRAESGTLEAKLNTLGGPEPFAKASDLESYSQSGAHFELRAIGAAVKYGTMNFFRDVHYLGRKKFEIED